MSSICSGEENPAGKGSGNHRAQSIASDRSDGSIKETTDDDYEKDHEHDEWPWLYRMFARVKQEVDGKPNQEVAECKAYLIQRSWIRSNFYQEMEEPSQEMSPRFHSLRPLGPSKVRIQGSSCQERHWSMGRRAR